MFRCFIANRLSGRTRSGDIVQAGEGGERVEILLSVYNGERFLPELLDSLRKQTYRNFGLIVRDDGSTDRSLQILREFGAADSPGVSVTKGENIGPVGSFNEALSESRTKYVMFCDQDDVWFPDKIEKTLKKMKEAEEAFGGDIPLLVHSDLCVTDRNLTVSENSYFKFQNLDVRNCSLNRLLLQNVPTGCTMMVNRPLVKLAGPIPEAAVMHDHWFSLVASAFGKIVCLDEPTLYYRQHGGNFYGASRYGWGYFYKRYRAGFAPVRKRLYQDIRQAEAFLLRYQSMLPAEMVEMLRDFGDIENRNWFQRRRILMRYRIYKSGWRRNIGTMLVI